MAEAVVQHQYLQCQTEVMLFVVEAVAQDLATGSPVAMVVQALKSALQTAKRLADILQVGVAAAVEVQAAVLPVGQAGHIHQTVREWAVLAIPQALVVLVLMLTAVVEVAVLGEVFFRIAICCLRNHGCFQTQEMLGRTVPSPSLPTPFPSSPNNRHHKLRLLVHRLSLMLPL
jgi:hypothetical protein